MKNYALSPLIEIFTMMTSSKGKIIVIFLVKNCLSYNISKSGRKLITGKRDNLNWTKKKMTSSKKYFFFYSLDANMMTFFTFSKSRWYEIVSPTHALSNHDIKIGGHWTFWRAISISKMACFWSNLHYIAHSSTRGFWTLTRTHGLIKGQEWLKLMEIVNCGKRNLNHVKI